MNKNYNLKLDLQFRCNNSTMKFNQFDNNTSDFFMKISNGGKSFDIEKAIVVLAVIKPSGKVSSQFVEVKNDIVYADLKPNMRDEIGTYTAQAMLILEDERVVTDSISYEVTEDKIFALLNDTVEATEDFTVLTDMLSRLSTIEITEEQRMINEAERILSEENRKIEEAKRVEAELIRQHEEADRTKYDAIRESNENIRKQNESIRLSNETNRIDEEAKRVEEENKRKLAEEERNANYNFMTEDEERRRSEANAHKEAEILRVQAETNRVNEEAKRRTTEQARVSAENTRVSNENTREASEETRQYNETKRVEAETQRQNRYNSFIAEAEANANNFENYTNAAKVKEEERKANELDRKSQETKRVSNEVERISNENTRKVSENARAEAEKQRVDAENLRTEKIIEIQTDYDSLKKVIIDENASANLQNQINQTNSQLEHIENQKADNLKVNSLEGRLNNIVAHNGDGTKDTEIIDARGNEATLGERLNHIDSSGYIVKDCVEVGNARYINSWDVGKGWGTVFSPSQLDGITHVELKKSIVAGTSRKVTTDVTITLFECDTVTISGVNNATVLENLVVSAEEWNEYSDETSIIFKFNKTHSVNLNKYYGVTVYNSDRINCSQVGYNNSFETIEEDTKTSSFLMGIWTNGTNNLNNYNMVSGNTYGLYVKLRGSNYKKQIKIEQEQVEGLKEFIEGPITLEKLPFLDTEYVSIGSIIETGSKSIQYDNMSKWATVIKGADFEIDRFVLNKYAKSSIGSDVNIKFYECNNVNDWINVTPIVEKNISATDFNNMELGEFEILLNQNILCSKDKYYVVRVESESAKLGLAQSGIDAAGNNEISEYFIDGYYNNNSTWNKISNKYGLYFKLKSIDYGELVKIKYDQVEGLKEKNIEIENRLDILEATNDNVKIKEEYIDVYNDVFVNNTNWIDNNSNWIFNNGLTPKAIGETNINNIKLNKPYHSDKRIMRFDINLFSDTVLDINMTRSNNNAGEGESIYRIDIPNKRLIMFGANSNGRGVDLSTILKVANINFNIVNGNKYLIEVEKNDFNFYFRIKDYLTANITEIELEGWGAGRQNHNYGFSWIAGKNAPTINNFKISMLNNPTCVFAGDSITEGVGMSSINMNNENNYTYRYAEILRNKLGNSVISAMGGDTIGTIISKFDSEYNHIKPKAISVTIGTNGGVNSNTLEQFKTLIDKSYSIGSKLIINLVPCGYSGNYLGVNENLLLLKQDENYKDKFILGCQFDVATAVDYYPYVDSEHPVTIAGQNTRVDSSLMTDNTHPNKAGSIRMANRYAVDVPEIFNL